MASTSNVAMCALAAAAFWTLLGLALARRVLADRALVFPLAPALGWAAFNAAALPVFLVAGLTRASIGTVVLFSAAAALAVLMRSRSEVLQAASPQLPLVACLAAVAVAVIPAVAVLPKVGDGGVLLAVPVFDHAKVALVDAMVRLGLPAINPVVGEVGGPATVSYYYLWHFSAATAALGTGVSGWEADAALTWFTAWSSLMLMMGLAVWLSRSVAAAFWALLLAVVGSLRPALEWLCGGESVDQWLAPAAGLAGWLFQSSWSPQHVQSACCAVLAVLLIAHLPGCKTLVIAAVLALVMAAGMQSSLWIGGVVFPIAGAIAALVVLRDQSWATRRWFALVVAASALAAVVLAAPLLIEQYHAALLRAVANPIAFAPQAVLGPIVPDAILRILDLPAFWTVFLVVAFPAVYPLGAIVLVRFMRLSRSPPEPARAVAALAALAATGLLASWLMVSTVGDNNDLGWRAILPGLLILTAFAAAGLANTPVCLSRPARAAAATLIVIGLPHTVAIARHNLLGMPSRDAPVLARSVELWEAVRRHAAPADRVANNPLFLQDTTLWPINISWALLADRSSCYAGRELALAFAPLSAGRRAALDAQFVRVFGGDAAPGDIEDLARRYDCRIAVITPRDGAWQRDPFAASPLFRLVEDESDRWRIYARQDDGVRGR